jgi:NAD-dependent deacetylase
MKDDLARAAEAVRDASNIAAFTGAGISAESGIPTYRGDEGTWTRFDPARFASAEYFFRDPSYYWAFFREERYPVLCAAQPNPGHRALVRLEEEGKLRCVITQNIDGLHQEAGSREVVELHGNTRTIACLGCGRTYGMEEIYQQLGQRPVPECLDCDGMLKTTVVLFGESLPRTALEKAFTCAARCELMIAVGSSLVVYPAAAVPQIAVEGGARLIIVNRDPTPLDALATVVLRGKAGEVLPRILGT